MHDDHTPAISRYIQPLGMRVLVRVIKEDDIHQSGLYLPAGSKEKMQEALYGEVLEVARTRPEDQEEKASLGENVSGIPNGVKILFPKHEGLKIPWDDSLRLLEVKNVLAIVEEVSRDAAH